MRRRAVILVLDGVGIGAASDAAAYGDVGSDTLGNLARSRGALVLPNLAMAGLGNIASLPGVDRTSEPVAAWGLMRPASAGKDSTAGHASPSHDGWWISDTHSSTTSSRIWSERLR